MFAMFSRKHELTSLGRKDYRRELIGISIIPAMYSMSFLFDSLNSLISQRFFIIPLFILLGRKISKWNY
jgi:hypothetical protein